MSSCDDETYRKKMAIYKYALSRPNTLCHSRERTNTDTHDCVCLLHGPDPASSPIHGTVIMVDATRTCMRRLFANTPCNERMRALHELPSGEPWCCASRMHAHAASMPPCMHGDAAMCMAGRVGLRLHRVVSHCRDPWPAPCAYAQHSHAYARVNMSCTRALKHTRTCAAVGSPLERCS
jgi:hypothetical protein